MMGEQGENRLALFCLGVEHIRIIIVRKREYHIIMKNILMETTLRDKTLLFYIFRLRIVS